jgi:hypothetical protein
VEDNRYYTPTIEEFHHGFLFEIKEGYLTYPCGEWFGQMFDKSDSLKHIESQIEQEQIRVPCLTDKDIEAEGFDHDEAIGEFISHKTYLGISTGDDKKLRIFYNPEDFYIEVYYVSNRGDEFTKFEGFVKNKIELQKILKMIKA